MGWQQYWGIFVCGGFGCLMRYGIGVLCPKPYWLAIFLANILGSFLIGICFGWVNVQKGNPFLLNILMVGFLGGLTTFSSWNLQIFKWLQSGQFWNPFFYILGSVALGILSLYLGFKLVSFFVLG